MSVEVQTNFVHVGLFILIQTKSKLTKDATKTQIKSSMHTKMLQIETRTTKCIWLRKTFTVQEDMLDWRKSVIEENENDVTTQKKEGNTWRGWMKSKITSIL